VTKIEYSIPGNEYVTLKIYDVTGKEVAVIVDSYMTGGRHFVIYDASDLASGIYFYRLSTMNFTQTNKMIFIK
jgi:hypothetical protein